MRPGTIDITVRRGEPFSKRFQILLNDTPLDLTGATIASQIREHADDPGETVGEDGLLAEFTATVVGDPGDGTFDLSLTKEQATAIVADAGVYDIDVEGRTYVDGRVSVTWDVTR